MKKILCALLCLCLMPFSLLIGCSDKDSGEYVLSVGFENAGLGDAWIQSLLTSFSEHEGIDRSKIRLIGDKGYTASVDSKLDSNTGIVDIMFLQESTQLKWAAQGWLEPLDDVFEKTVSTGQKIKNIIKPGYQQSGFISNIHGDHYYTFPFTEGVAGLYYNKTMFDEKGWQIPTTFAALKALANKIYIDHVLDEADPNKKIYPFVCSPDIVSYWDFLVQNWWVQVIGIEEFEKFCLYDSPSLYNPENTITAGKLTALNAFKELIGDNPSWTISNSSDFIAAQMLFVQGRAAMIPNGSWLEVEMKSSLPEGVDIAIMPTPFLPSAKKDGLGNPIPVSFTTGNDSIIIPKAAKNKEMAKRLIAFFCEEKQVLDFVQHTGGFRPIQFDTDKLENLTVCQQSVLNVWKNSQTFAFKSNNPLAFLGYAQVWKLGYPYGKMLFKDNTGKVQTPIFILNAEYNYVNNEWNNWLKDAGVL